MMVVQDTQAQANNAAFIWAETNNTTTGAVYAPGTRQNVNQDVLNYQRNNAVTAYAVQNADINIWDGTTHILTEIDDGTTGQESIRMAFSPRPLPTPEPARSPATNRPSVTRRSAARARSRHIRAISAAGL
jgi:hypothetical protein